MYEIGLASIAFRHLSVEQIIAAAKEAGLSCIEWGSDIHAPKDDLENIQRVRALTEKAGLHCSSYGAYFRIDRDPVQDIYGYIAAAKALGVTVIRIWCPGNPSTLPPEALQERYQTCRDLARIAAEQGITLCAECHSGNLTDNGISSVDFMEAVSNPAFRMYWQPNENFTPEENIAFANAAAPYVVNVHVFNWQQRTRLPLETAKSAWTEYVRCLGTNRCFLLEHLENDDVSLLPRETQTLKEILSAV